MTAKLPRRGAPYKDAFMERHAAQHSLQHIAAPYMQIVNRQSVTSEQSKFLIEVAFWGRHDSLTFHIGIATLQRAAQARVREMRCGAHLQVHQIFWSKT
jgi:hypothetical protein